MSRTTRTCASTGCDGVTRDTGIVCDSCIRDLERALGDVAAITDTGRHLAVELLLTATRQTRLTDTPNRGQTEPDDEHRDWPQTTAITALPFDIDAAELGWVLANTLGTWARLLIEDHPPLVGPTCPACTHPTCTAERRRMPADAHPPTVAAWLLGRLEQVRHHEAADEIVDEIVDCVRHVERAVDRPADRWYAGPCTGQRLHPDGPGLLTTCGAELYVKPGAERFTCRDCGGIYDVAERRAWLLAETENQLAHAELIARAITSLGEPVTSAMVRGYAARGRIVPHSIDGYGRPLYRVGDVLEVARDVLRAKAEKQARTERQTRRDQACA